MYETDSTDGKSYPKAKSNEAYGYASTPAEETFVERPSYVLINVNGTYAFSYSQTGSNGGTHADEGAYTTGSILNDAAGGPTRLDINPNAWRQTNSAGSIGDVTFVYKGD